MRGERVEVVFIRLCVGVLVGCLRRSCEVFLKQSGNSSLVILLMALF